MRSEAYIHMWTSSDHRNCALQLRMCTAATFVCVEELLLEFIECLAAEYPEPDS